MSFHLEYLHYRRQYVRCGNPPCKKCPHGPYWYAYQHSMGKMKKIYVGKNLPEAVIASVRRNWPELADRLLSRCDS